MDTNTPMIKEWIVKRGTGESSYAPAWLGCDTLPLEEVLALPCLGRKILSDLESLFMTEVELGNVCFRWG